ncbi:MAG: hypothetical protein DRJ40_01560 [Thermoprotei archaeon]|nr:MAG: hypothetical protein DRJ40_01560 [Thermoprotei archaeon]
MSEANYDCLVLTLGFEPGPLLRAIASYGVKANGTIVVLTAEYRDERCERAFLDLQKLVRMLFKDERGRHEINIRRVDVCLNPVLRGVEQVSATLREFVNSNVCIAFTGGMRVLWIILLMTYLLLPWKYEPKLVAYLEGRGEFVEIPPIRSIFELAVHGTRLEILRAIGERPKTVDELSSELNRDRSTIYRNILWLEEKGLVKKVGRTIELTDLGRVLSLSQPLMQAHANI